jgi:hypothetical protein
MDWLTFREQVNARSAHAARDALSARFASVTSDRPELGRTVGSQQRTEPLHATVPYKEAFSPTVVRDVLDSAGVTDGRLLDPFAGAGTSLLVAAERGLTPVGVDILPFASFAARTLLYAPTADLAAVDELAAQVLSRPPSRTGRFPDFPVRSWAFGPAALAQLSDLSSGIAALDPGPERDLLRLALLCSVEPMSQATKDGTSLRRRPHGRGRHGRYGSRRTRSDVRAEFEARLELLRQGAQQQPPPPAGTDVFTGDARTLPTLLDGQERFDVAVLSPPYPNRYDYVSNYQLELGFGFIDDAAALRVLRKAQLRSHMEAPWPAGERTVELAALDEFLSAFLASEHRGNESGRVFRMVCGYFEDMAAVLAGMHSMMYPGSVTAIVVGTQVFGGEQLPTDLLLAAIAEQQGYTVKELWVARTKGMAVQQRRKLGRPVSSRETVLLLSA